MLYSDTCVSSLHSRGLFGEPHPTPRQREYNNITRSKVRFVVSSPTTRHDITTCDLLCPRAHAHSRKKLVDGVDHLAVALSPRHPALVVLCLTSQKTQRNIPRFVQVPSCHHVAFSTTLTSMCVANCTFYVLQLSILRSLYHRLYLRSEPVPFSL